MYMISLVEENFYFFKNDKIFNRFYKVVSYKQIFHFFCHFSLIMQHLIYLHFSFY
jgi:hypothetical protein